VLAHQGRPPDAPTIETIVTVTFYEIIKIKLNRWCAGKNRQRVVDESSIR